VDSARHELLAKVASMYYEREMTQQEIAAALGLSRIKIYRLLKQAREARVARIIIDWHIKRAAALERGLCARFGLEAAFVLQGGSGDAALRLRQVAQMAARYLEGVLPSAQSLCICFGSSTYELIHAIRPDFQVPLRVLQGTGSLPQALKELDSSALTRQLAQKLGGEALYLPAPLLADSAEAAAVIRCQTVVAQSLAQVRGAELALVGIGNIDPATSSFLRAGVLDIAELRALRAAGAVGDIAWQLLDAHGQLFACELSERIIGLSLADLQRIPRTVAVASGRGKARAILGALRSGAVQVLCTDEAAAQQVLALAAGDSLQRHMGQREALQSR